MSCTLSPSVSCQTAITGARQGLKKARLLPAKMRGALLGDTPVPVAGKIVLQLAVRDIGQLTYL